MQYSAKLTSNIRFSVTIEPKTTKKKNLKGNAFFGKFRIS